MSQCNSERCTTRMELAAVINRRTVSFSGPRAFLEEAGNLAGIGCLDPALGYRRASLQTLPGLPSGQWHTDTTKAQSISKFITFLSKLLKSTQYSYWKYTQSLHHDLLHSALNNPSANTHHKNFGTNHSLIWKEKACKNATAWISFPRLTLLGPRRRGSRSSRWNNSLQGPTPLSSPGAADPASPYAQGSNPSSPALSRHQAEFKMYSDGPVKLFCLKKYHFLWVQPLIQLSVINAFAQVWTNFSVYRTDWINIPVRGRKFITATA